MARPSTAPSWAHWWQRNQDEFLWDERGRGKRSSPRTYAEGPLTGRGSGPRPGDRPTRANIYTQIVPDLLSIVAESNDEQLLATAAVALGRTVEPPFEGPVLDALTELLGHHDLDVRAAAALGMGLVGSHDGTLTLLHLASCTTVGHALVGEDTVPDAVRASAALALGYVNDPSAVPSMIQMCEDLPDAERELKSCLLVALGLQDNQASDHAAAYLTAKLTDRRLDPAIASAVPIGLARLGRPGAVDALLGTLADPDADTWVAQSAVIGLGHCATFDRLDVIDTLIEIVEEERNPSLRQFAVIALGRLAGRDTEPSTHTQTHDQVTRLLRKQLNKPKRSVDRPWAAIAAGLYGRGQPARAYSFAERLEVAYDDVKDPARRGAYALGLGLLGHDAFADELERDFEASGDEPLRGQLAVALGLMSHHAVEQQLRQALTDKGTSVGLRRSLGAALRLLDDRTASVIVGESYSEASSLAHRAGLAVALGQLREQRSVDLLTSSANDGELDPASRASACSALGRVAEKTLVPFTARLSVDSNIGVPLATLDRLLAAR